MVSSRWKLQWPGRSTRSITLICTLQSVISFRMNSILCKEVSDKASACRCRIHTLRKGSLYSFHSHFSGSSSEHIGKSFIRDAPDGRCWISSPYHCRSIWRYLGCWPCYLRCRICELWSEGQIFGRPSYSFRWYSFSHYVNEARIHHDNEEQIVDDMPTPKHNHQKNCWHRPSLLGLFLLYSTFQLEPP